MSRCAAHGLADFAAGRPRGGPRRASPPTSTAARVPRGAGAGLGRAERCRHWTCAAGAVGGGAARLEADAALDAVAAAGVAAASRRSGDAAAGAGLAPAAAAALWCGAPVVRPRRWRRRRARPSSIARRCPPTVAPVIPPAPTRAVVTLVGAGQRQSGAARRTTPSRCGSAAARDERRAHTGQRSGRLPVG